MRAEITRWPMLNCEDTGKLISMSKDHRIGLWRRTQIRLHIAMCDVCKGYYKFVYRIGGQIRKDSVKVRMPAEMREALKANIEKSLRKP